MDLTSSQCSRNVGNENPQDNVIKALQKFDVNFEELKEEVNILDFQIVQSQDQYTNCVFEEYESVSYKILFVTYNVKFYIRLLSFQNESQCQILKLDIQPKTANIKQEIEYCCNSLQRRRNLPLMFTTLISFGRFLEARRLVCDLTLKNNQFIRIEQNNDGGIIIVYADDKRNVRLGIFWSITCSSTHEVRDVVEVYYNVVELPTRAEIEYKLNQLTKPCLNFTEKYHLWTSVINDLSEKTLLVVLDRMPGTSTTNTVSSNCHDVDQHEPRMATVLSDSEENPARSPVVEVDKLLDRSKRKIPTTVIVEREAESVTVLSDSETFSKRSLVVKVDKMPDNYRKKKSSTSHGIKELATETEIVLSESDEFSRPSVQVKVDKLRNNSKRKVPITDLREREAEPVTVLSDSEEFSRRSLVVKVDKMPGNSKIVMNRCDITNETQKAFRKSLVVAIEKMPATGSTETVDLDSEKDKTDLSRDILNYLRLEKSSIIRQYVEEKAKKSLRLRSNRLLKYKENKSDSAKSSDSEIIYKKGRLDTVKSSNAQVLPVKRKNRRNPISDSSDYNTESSNSSESSNSKGSERENLKTYHSSDEGYKPHRSCIRKEKKWLLRKNTPSIRKSACISTIDSTSEEESSIMDSLRKKSRGSFVRNGEGRSRSAKSFLQRKEESTLLSPIPTHFSTSHQKTLRQTPNRILVSNSLLKAVTANGQTNARTSSKNIRIRLVPDGPVSGAPDFMEVNLIAAANKPNKDIDDDLELASVTYVVSD